MSDAYEKDVSINSITCEQCGNLAANNLANSLFHKSQYGQKPMQEPLRQTDTSAYKEPDMARCRKYSYGYFLAGKSNCYSYMSEKRNIQRLDLVVN